MRCVDEVWLFYVNRVDEIDGRESRNWIDRRVNNRLGCSKPLMRPFHTLLSVQSTHKLIAAV